MDLTAYLRPGWKPFIRPAPLSRAWMDATSDAFAYRCLPLNIANAHGWEILSPHGFEAIWDGGPERGSVRTRLDEGWDLNAAPAGFFGFGTLTFHVDAIFRTPPGWNLWIGGSPNRAKDAIAPLTGIVETDWSPFTFTMNWRFTRPDQWVRFDAMEPFCFFFPVQREAIEQFQPAYAALGSDPDTEARFKAWGDSRAQFNETIKSVADKPKSEQWQKHYFRGTDLEGTALADGHRSKIRVKRFDSTAAADVPPPPYEDTAAALPAPAAAVEASKLGRALARRDWLAETIERQRDLAGAMGIERRMEVSRETFLSQYYAMARPTILVDELLDWPPDSHWTPDALSAAMGAATVDYHQGWAQDGLSRPSGEIRGGVFDALIGAVTAAQTPEAANATAVTLCLSPQNQKGLQPLAAWMRPLDKFLQPQADAWVGALQIGGAGALTPLHQSLRNAVVVQIAGRSRVRILPASEAGRLYGGDDDQSAIPDLEAPHIDLGLFPRLSHARAYDFTLEAGEVLFLPLGWWRQIKAAEFSVTTTSTAFIWPNGTLAQAPDL